MKVFTSSCYDEPRSEIGHEIGEVENKGPGNQGGMRSGLAAGLSLAFEFAGAVFLFWFLGRLVDSWLEIEPWGQVVGSLIGWLGGTLHVYYSAQRRQGG